MSTATDGPKVHDEIAYISDVVDINEPISVVNRLAQIQHDITAAASEMADLTNRIKALRTLQESLEHERAQLDRVALRYFTKHPYGYIPATAWDAVKGEYVTYGIQRHAFTACTVALRCLGCREIEASKAAEADLCQNDTEDSRRSDESVYHSSAGYSWRISSDGLTATCEEAGFAVDATLDFATARSLYSFDEMEVYHRLSTGLCPKHRSFDCTCSHNTHERN